MTQLYYTHIFPHLIGGISIWGSSDPRKTYLQPLIKAQKRIIRLIRRVRPGTHTKPIMTQLQILNITSLYIHRVCAEMHPFIYPSKQLNRPEHNHSYTPVSEIHDHATRYATAEHQYISDTEEHFTAKHSTVWNTIPLELRCIATPATFKEKLKLYLLARQNEQ